MARDLRLQLLRLAGAALVACAGVVASQSSLAPVTLRQAVTGGLALGAIVFLGATGLSMLRGHPHGLAAPGAGAILLSVVSLAGAAHHPEQLAFIGALNLCLAGGLRLRALRLEQAQEQASPEPKEKPPA